MGWTPALVAALFFVPLWATGELGVWSFEEPRSHLVWDEGAQGSGLDGRPQAGDEPGGAAGVAARLALGAVVAGAVAWSVGRRAAG